MAKNLGSTFQEIIEEINSGGSGSVVLPDNVAEYDGATSSGEIIVSDETSNKIKTSAIKIAKSRVTTANTGETTGDGMWGSNVRSTDEEMPTSRAVCEALRGTFDYFVAIGETQADRTEIAENEVVIGDPSFLMKAAVRGSRKFLTNDYDFGQEGKPIDDTHIPTTKVVKTIVDDALLDSDGVSVVSQVNGITSGTKRLKKVLIGSTENAGSITYETKEDNTESLILSAEHDIGLRVNEQSGVEIVDRDIDIYVPEEDASIISIRGGDVSIKGAFSGVSLTGANSEQINLAQGNILLSSQNNININSSGSGSTQFKGNVDFTNATVIGLPSGGGEPIDTSKFVTVDTELQTIFSKKVFNKEVYFGGRVNIGVRNSFLQDFENSLYIHEPEEIKYISPKHTFEGEVDFTEATIKGLNLGSETLAIEVEELPTENIDDSKIYILSAIENTEVYYHFETGYFTLKDLVATTQGIQADITYYVVKELPTSPLTSNLATFSTVHCYIYNDIAYVYGNAGYGNMWLTVSTLVSQISGITVIDKGRTPNIATENSDIAMYVYYEDYKKFYLYSNEQWVQITDSKSNTYVLSLNGTSGTLTDEQYQAIKDNFPNVIVLYNGDDGITLVLPIVGIVSGAYFAMYTTNITSTSIIIAPSKEWMYTEESYSHNYVTVNGVHQDINGSKTFNGDVTFDCPVDFSNATVTGLPTAEVDTSNLVTLDTEQTISGKKTFSGIKIGNANIDWNESGFKELDIKIDEGNGALVFRADDVSLLSDNDIMIERGGLSAVNVSSSGIYIYDENVDTGNCANISFEDGIISLSSDNKIDFSGKVDFTNATVTGLPSGGLDISPATIEYNNDTNILIINSPDNLQIQAFNGNTTLLGNSFSLSSENENGDIAKIHCAEGLIEIEADNGVKYYGNVDFTNATVTGLPSNGGSGSIDTNADYNWNGNHTFNNGFTLNGALTLANNGQISDSEEQLQIYKGTGSMWIGTEEGGYIDINDDEMRVESFTPLTVLSNQDLTFVAVGNIGIYSGENDDTSFYISPSGMDVTANNGNINFTTGNQGSIHFTANGNESYTSINLYDTSIEYNAQAHQFFGEVDFSDANVTGLPSSGLDIPEEVINYDSENNYLSFSSDSVSLLASNENSSIEMTVGGDDETTAYFSTSQMRFSSVGVVNFTGNEGINFTAGEEASTKFNGNVDFSNANVTGLSASGSSDLTELKRVMRLLHTEKYTQSIQATKFTSTPMGSIHKIEKPSNDLLEASEYVLYSVDFEDTPAYLNATITIGNNGLINDSGTFSFTVQGSSIAAGQNINVICVFVPSAFL